MAGPLSEFCINKGAKFTLKDRYTGAVVGSLNPRESFVYMYDDGEGSIGFLASDGTFKTVAANMNGLTMYTCIDFPYSIEVIDGTEYYIFKMRKSASVYRGDGSKWGTVAANMFVATTNATMGESHKTWKMINYVKSTSGAWVKVQGNGYSHGFVDTGLTSASGYSVVHFYGSW